MKGLSNSGRPEEALSYSKKNPTAKLHLAANQAERQVRKLRERKRNLEQSGAPKEQIQSIEEQMIKRMESFNELAKRTAS